MVSTIPGRVVGIVLLVIALVPAAAQNQAIKVIILGTGTPAPVMKRFGPSILVEAGGEKFLFDSGRGAAQRLHQLKISLSAINPVFLTHLHSDHVVGLPDLWLTGWLVWHGGRQVPLRVLGPVGTNEMTSFLEKAFQFDIRSRGSRQHAREGAVLVGEDIKEGVVYEKNDVTVTAFNVDHGNVPTFGYRIDYGRHSVVISGDTSFSENLIKFSKGVDLLIHEVLVASKEELRTSQQLRSFDKFHTIPEQAGEVFTRIRPKLAVFTHIQERNHTVDDLIALTRRTYAGPLEVGEDLLVIDVGEEVTVRRLATSLR